MAQPIQLRFIKLYFLHSNMQVPFQANIRRIKRTATKRKAGKGSRRRRGRPIEKFLRSLIAIGAKLRMGYTLTIYRACQIVNSVCNDSANAAVQSEGKLYESTLRKHVNKYMAGANWSDLNPEEHMNLWRHVIQNQCPQLEVTIYGLVDLVCVIIAGDQPAAVALPAQQTEDDGSDIEEGDEGPVAAAIDDHMMEFSDSECFLPHEADATNQHLDPGDVDNGLHLDEATSSYAEALNLADGGLDDAALEALDLPGLPLIDDLDINAMLATLVGGDGIAGMAMGAGLDFGDVGGLLDFDE